MISFKELRERLTPEDIKNILSTQYNEEPYYDKEDSNYIIYRTCCHDGDSHKLYYYKNTHLFKCYTHCGLFDIFELIIKLEALQGRTIGKIDAVARAGFKISEAEQKELESDSIVRDLNRLFEINAFNQEEQTEINLDPIDISFLDERYTFDTNALQTWVQEGISLLSMIEYRITYDTLENCIIIPQFDENGIVVGVRGRFFNEDSNAKYKPVIYNGKVLRHPLSQTLYGFYQNKEAMKMTKSAIIFESEKSVLKLATLYGDRNISVATCGQTISRKHIDLLLSIGVTKVVLAYDADYLPGSEEMNEVFKTYKYKAEPLKTYFDVSIIIDTKGRLKYKDSPIDQGLAVFTELMRERINI